MKQLSLAALVAAVVAGLVAFLGGFAGGVELPKVSVTIALIQTQGGCQVVTVPASPLVLPGQDVEWTVAGGCSDIDNANIEVRFEAKTGDSCYGDNPLVGGTLKGKKIKAKVKTDAGHVQGSNRYCYGIYNPPNTMPLEDPDLDIRKR